MKGVIPLAMVSLTVGALTSTANPAQSNPVASIERDQPPAKSGLILASQMVQAIASGTPAPPGWDNPHQLQPRYLRVSRAEEVRRQKLAEQGRS